MADHRLSQLAAADIATIADYTIKNFGIVQARRYRDGLVAACQVLADHPHRGRSADELAPKLRRWHYESHVIFYLPSENGALIVRVLHQRMDFERHLMPEE